MKKALWAVALILLIGIGLLPLVNLATIGSNSLSLDWSTKASLEQLAQYGDFFGGHTAAFSGALSVALILYFSLRQSQLQQEHFEEQLRISKRAADLASINNIYSHYGESYGKSGDSAQILAHVANGHRRWAIRESFSIIDPEAALEEGRRKQVANEFQSLVKTLNKDQLMHSDFRHVAELTSSLLIDKRLAKEVRGDLWGLYEVLREDPIRMIDEGTETHQRFQQEKRFIIGKHRSK